MVTEILIERPRWMLATNGHIMGTIDIENEVRTKRYREMLDDEIYVDWSFIRDL